MKRTARLATLVSMFALSGFTPSANASAITYDGSFSATFTTANIPSTVSGTFSFAFDTTLATGPGPQTFSPTLTSLSMTQLGSTTFTPANTGLQLDYNGGVLSDAIIGGLLNGVTQVNTATNDFFVEYTGSTLNGEQFSNAAASTTASIAGNSVSPSSGQIMAVSAVPEPASLVMLGTSVLAGLGYLWRRHRAKSRPAG